MFATQWFMTLFSQKFPFSVVLRIWDIFLAEGLKIIFRVSFQWKNPDFPLRNPDFLLKNPDFLLRNPDFLLNNVDFITKQVAVALVQVRALYIHAGD